MNERLYKVLTVRIGIDIFSMLINLDVVIGEMLEYM